MKLMKLNAICFYCLTLMVGITVGGCSEDDSKPFLETSTTRFILDYDGLTENGNNANFEIGSNVPWKVISHDQWIVLTHAEGERGRQKIFLTVEENLTGTDREGSIVIEGGGITRKIMVAQKLKIETLSVSPITINLAKSGLLETGDQATIDLTANSNWEIVECPEWITADKVKGKAGNATIVLTVLQNKTGGERIGEIKFVSASLNKTVTVTQTLAGLETNISAIRVNKTGTIDGVNAMFKLKVANNWTLNCDGWIHPNQTSGTPGEVTIKLTFDEYNGTSAKRASVANERGGKITITTIDGLETEVTIVQTSKASAYEDDAKPMGYVYLNEDFSFLKSLGKDDQVTNPLKGSMLPLNTHAAAAAARTYFEEHGYADFNSVSNCMYLASDYLKMGKTNHQTGLCILLKTIEADKSTDITLTFNAIPVIVTTGKTYETLEVKSIDKTTVSVEILEGPGVVNNGTSRISDPIPLTDITTWGTWGETRMVTLNGVTSKTRIVLRPTQQGQSGLWRWFLDNVKMVKTTN